MSHYIHVSTDSLSASISNQRAPAEMPASNRERFLAACHCRHVDRPPVWMMRQAGRALPEYRALKESHSFVEMVKTPELAAEVTLQPVRRFGFDAAILFSDILVVPEAMGQSYHFRESGGIEMEFALRSGADIDRLDPEAVAGRLSYMGDALRIIKKTLDGKTALIGFAGSPWTLANFMIEGGGSRDWHLAKQLFYNEPALFARLMEKLARAVAACLQVQIEAGAEVVQIFDTLGGLLAPDVFGEASARWIRQVVASIPSTTPVIVFSKGANCNWETLVETGANILGVDWTQRLAAVREKLPHDVGVQGNLDSALLCASPEAAAAATSRLLESMRGVHGHIFNLGHGVTPDARLESIAAVVETVRGEDDRETGRQGNAEKSRISLSPPLLVSASSSPPLQVDLDLVKKYNVAGPRYTSYPPATKFTDNVSWDDLSARIEANNHSERDLSIYFHIPFCETLCWFCGCTTVITLNHDKGRHYIDYLEREVAQMKPRLNPARKAVQLHFGGGSPTFLRPDEIRRLGGIIHKHFTFSPDIEASVEVDPRRLTRDHLAALREIGFNRASMGVQDFNPQVQESVHRIQPREMTRQAIDWMRELGYGSINLDLIYGLPHQSVESFNETLDTVLEMQPDRLAVFSYAHVPWIKPAQKILEQQQHLPAAETKLGILKLVIEKLTAGGQYVYIGMDHFARPGDELAVAQRNKQLQRNFQGYSTRAGSDIYAFGMSSISQIPDAYWQNEKELPKYQEAVDAGRVPLQRAYFMTSEDKIRRETIMRVMCDLAIDYVTISQRLGIDFERHFAGELLALAPYEADGLVKRSPAGFEITDTGRLFIRNIAMCFDSTLAPAGERQHSRTI